jgi:hypothetical protein
VLEGTEGKKARGRTASRTKRRGEAGLADHLETERFLSGGDSAAALPRSELNSQPERGNPRRGNELCEAFGKERASFPRAGWIPPLIGREAVPVALLGAGLENLGVLFVEGHRDHRIALDPVAGFA